MADLAVHDLAQKEGFLDLIFLGVYETGDYHWITLWKTKTLAVRAFQDWCPSFNNLLGDHGVLNQPVVHYYQVQPVKNFHRDG